MSFWIWMNRGHSMPGKSSIGRRISSWFGRRMALRNRNTNINKSCIISPLAHINPRSGEINIGKNSTIALGTVIQGNVTIGDSSSVQAYSNIVGYGKNQDSEGAVIIGDNVRIACYSVMIGGNHRFDNVEIPIQDQGLEYKTIIIEDDVWIGARVNILPGVKVSKGSVIGAGSVVTKDIPPYSVAVGVPAKVIKSRKPI